MSNELDPRPPGERRYGIDKHLTWLGSKYDCRQLIAWCVPSEVSEVHSPFFGSGAVEFELLRKRPKLSLAASDLDQALVIFWQAMLASSDQVAQCLAKCIPRSRPITRETFDHMRVNTLVSLKKVAPQVTAARFWLLNHLAWSGNMGCLGYAAKRAERLRNTRDQLLKHVRGFHAPLPKGRLTVTQQDAITAIKMSPKAALLLLDPPYLDRVLGTTKSHKQYNCGPNWGIKKHRELQTLLQSHPRWILCHEDIPEIRELYRGYRVLEYVRGSGGGTKVRTVAEKHASVGQSFRPELLILSQWVAERLPDGEPPMPPRTVAAGCPNCPKCKGLRKDTPNGTGAHSLQHKCPLSGARPVVGCVDECSVCGALLPTSRREGVHQAHCKHVWPELWRVHSGPCVRPAFSSPGSNLDARISCEGEQRPARKRPASSGPGRRAQRLKAE